MQIINIVNKASVLANFVSRGVCGQPAYNPRFVSFAPRWENEKKKKNEKKEKKMKNEKNPCSV